MRLKSAIYVQALMRRAEVAGAQAYLVRRGAEEAGAIFLKLNRLDGSVTVLAPAPGSRMGGESERVWARPLGESAPEDKARDYFDKQIKYDPDIWIVEIEDRQGRTFVDEKVV